MIIDMTKYSFLIFHREYHEFLNKLKALGVVHIRENTDPKEIEQVREIMDKKKEVDDFISRMKGIRANKLKDEESAKDIPHIELPDDIFTDAEVYMDQVRHIDQRIEQTTKEIHELTSRRAELIVWGEFDPELIKRLEKEGHHFHFWSIPAQQYDERWADEYDAVVVNEARRYVYFVTVTNSSTPPDIPAERLVPPLVSITHIDSEIDARSKRRDLLRDTLVYLSTDTTALETYALEIEDRFNMSNAYYQGEKMYDDKLVILEGFVPSEIAPALEQALDAEDYAYAQMEIVEGEKVPIKLKNNFFVRAFEPIVKMFSLPNYYEIDPTPFVAPFFMLFFALCFGDAGYGLLLFLACTIAKPKLKESMRPLVTMFQWLGGAAFIIGFFSGSFFGIELAKVDFLADVRQFFISSDSMMIVAIAIGLINILVARYVAAFKTNKQKGIKHSVSQFAWTTFILLAIVFVVIGLPQINITTPAWLNYLLFGLAGFCAIFMIFFNMPGKGIVMNIGNFLWTTYNTVSGLLGDTLSYIRLFAIGLTGAILGNVFNTLAFDMTSSMSPWIRWLPLLLILLFGHTINFALTMIGSLVHPIRLIFVEYFKNSEYEGGGKAYKPLKKINPERL